MTDKSNSVVEIMARALAIAMGWPAARAHMCENTADQILAALESSGYKVMARKPTKEMISAYWLRMASEGTIDIRTKEALKRYWDAAPKFGGE